MKIRVLIDFERKKIINLDDVKPSDTIACLLDKIQAQENFDDDTRQRLEIDYKNQQLDEEWNTLSFYNIKNNSELVLRKLGPLGLIKLLVQTHLGKTLILDVNGSDTISEVKTKIQNVKDLPGLKPTFLMFRDKKMDDSQTLSYIKSKMSLWFCCYIFAVLMH